MSVQSLYTAATGMDAMQTKLDVIANNMANINTMAFKKDRANFEDLFYRQEVTPGARDAQGTPSATGTLVGLGTRVASTQINFKQGAFQDTNRSLDVAIEGKGFFQVTDANSGDTVYTRAGNFNINAEGQLVLGSAFSGRPLTDAVSIDPKATDIVIQENGDVLQRLPNTQNLQTAGTIQLATFVNPEGLLKLGDNVYAQTDASGQATPSAPGQQGVGLLRQGMVEASNVEPVEELIDLITTQRSFELNSQTVQAGDQILQLISNLRRF